MARKKQEIALMREIESQEEWEDIMAKEGLWVVDVYQEWCGPCDAMVGNFRRIKNELGDELLHFAMGKADTIEALEKYRGSCEPCFLFFAGGVLVSFIHGANAPLILRNLTEQLAQEHKVLDGNAERKEVKDPFVTNRMAESIADEEEEEEEEGYIRHRRVSTRPEDYEEGGRKFQYRGELIIYDDELTPAEQYEEVEEGFTVALIKPNVVAEGKTDEILAEMKAKGIKVIAQEQRQLTEEEAREFYSHLKDEDFFEELVRFMSSGPSHVLVLTKGQANDSIITDWRDMLGPPAVEDAKEQAPESLRARFGDAGLMNALHGSDSKETAARELAFFFPHMDAPKLKKKVVQRTLALIRPDAFASQKDEILQKIKDAGFEIALSKVVSLSREQAENFYKEHEGQPYFEDLVTRMSSGPMLALGLARDDAVTGWREMLGPPDLEEAKTNAPDSLRAQFALDENPLNQLHGSDSPETAKAEIDYFFPMEQTVAMIKPDAYGTKDAIIEKIHEAGFRIAAQKEDHITKEIAEAFYEDQKDKDYFNDLVEHMISGPTMFMVLSREDAVEGWRKVIGPTDPEEAKEQAPDSLRAQFGQDVLQNAVHGCSNKEEAQQKIEKIFGHLEFAADGTVKGAEGEQEQQAEQQQKQEEQQQQQEQQPEEPKQEEAAKEEEAPAAKEEEAEAPKEEAKAEEQAQEEEKPQEETGAATGEGEEETVDVGEEQTPSEPEQGQEQGEQPQEVEPEPAKTEDAGEGEGEAQAEQKPEEEKEEGAEKAAEDEQKPSEEKEKGTEKAAEDEQKPSEEKEKGTEKAAEDEQKPSEEKEKGTEKAAEDEQKPSEEKEKGTEKAAEDEQKPSEEKEKGTEKAAEDEQKPSEEKEKGTEKAAEDEQKPSEEEKGTGKRPEAESSHSVLDMAAGEAAKEEASKVDQPAETAATEQQQQEIPAGEAEKQEPAAEEQKAEEPKMEEPKAEEPKAEEQKEEGKADTKPGEEVKADDSQQQKADDSQQQKDADDTAAKN